MVSVTFDTLKYFKQLECAGVPAAQAEAFANAQREILAEALDSTLATKTDVVRIEHRLDTLEAKLEAVELHLTVKLGAFIAIAAGVIIAVLRLPH